MFERVRDFFLGEDEYAYSEEDTVDSNPEPPRENNTNNKNMTQDRPSRNQNRNTQRHREQSTSSSSFSTIPGSNRTNNSDDRAISSVIVIREPRVYPDVMEIAKLIREDESVLVNFKLMDEYQARRSIDFFTGVVFTLDGEIQNIGGQIFLLTPASVSVEASEELSLLARQNYEEFDL
jgi:Uncharacterized protein conserved in bacteria